MSSPRHIPTIVSQHAEEAAFQWLLRNAAVHAPHYSLIDLAALDTTVDAHLDGLRIAGDAGWEICRQDLAWEEPGELFAAAYLAFAAGATDRIEAILETAVKVPDAGAGLASALGWLEWEQARPHIQSLLGAETPLLRRLGLAASAIQRQDPGPALDAALHDVDPVSSPRALRAAGELGRRELLPRCRDLVGTDDSDTAFWAAWAAALLGDQSDAEPLVEIAASSGPHAERACRTVARRLDPARALDWRRQLAGDDEKLRLAAIAAGASGDPQIVPWLIELMAVDEHARPAGEAFSLITGVDLAYIDLERDQPEDFAAGPSEDADDEDVALDPDEDLPWPAPDLVSAWWTEHGRRFEAGQRYLLGEKIADKSLRQVLVSGLQRQRAAAALELVFMQPGRLLFEVRARGDRQRRQLGA